MEPYHEEGGDDDDEDDEVGAKSHHKKGAFSIGELLFLADTTASISNLPEHRKE